MNLEFDDGTFLLRNAPDHSVDLVDSARSYPDLALTPTIQIDFVAADGALGELDAWFEDQWE